MKIQVCILNKKKNIDNPTISLLKKHFDEVVVYTNSFYSFSDARNKCIDKSADFVIRFDSDEEMSEESIINLKKDIPAGLVFAKFVFSVGKYTWVDGFKLISHPTSCYYIGPAHEILICDQPRVYDENVELLHKKTEYDFYYSIARTYYLTANDVELRKIIGEELTVEKFRRLISRPTTELKEWAKKQTGCDPRRAFYYLIFGELPNECPIDLPQYAAIANKVYEKVRVYDPFLPYYIATHPQIDIDRVAELNRVYMHLLGRPIDEKGIETYYNMDKEKVIESILNSLFLKKE